MLSPFVSALTSKLIAKDLSEPEWDGKNFSIQFHHVLHHLHIVQCIRIRTILKSYILGLTDTETNILTIALCYTSSLNIRLDFKGLLS